MKSKKEIEEMIEDMRIIAASETTSDIQKAILVEKMGVLTWVLK